MIQRDHIVHPCPKWCDILILIIGVIGCFFMILCTEGPGRVIEIWGDLRGRKWTVNKET